MIRHVLASLLRLGARLTVVWVAYDLWTSMVIGPAGMATLAQVAGGVLAGAVTIIIGKFLYDTFLPISRAS
jgi:hypothetical protein